ncbi:MAG TPA: histidine phosphatase family protein [Candidatus Binataceae bacterium]
MSAEVGKLILVRHGESEGNRDRRFTSSAAVPLTDLGRKQARIAAQRIKLLFQPELVIASPFARARETGEIIAGELALPIEIDDGFHEQSLGELAGKSYDVMREPPEHDPSHYWEWRAPGGESLQDVRERTGSALDRVAAKLARRQIVIVSHGGVMASLWAHVTGNWEDAHIMPNAAIVIIERLDGRYMQPWVLRD